MPRHERRSSARTSPDRAGVRSALRGIAVLLAAILVATAARAQVVINEIHYHPPSPDGKTLEFVELVNLGGSDVTLDGWRFVEGVRFSFPEGALLPAGGFVVVARDRAAFLDGFGISDAGVFGDAEGALDNGGEEIVLVNAENAVVDAVRYGDDAPWPEAADGDGASLQRRCGSSPSSLPWTWSAVADQPPTPLGANTGTVCPAPAPPVPAVAITEIHYHPIDDTDEEDEFIELFNTSGEPVDLTGWSFEAGVEFVFPVGSVLEPREYVVVARNAQHISDTFGIANVVGDFVGALSNQGERLSLVDATGALVDSVTYRDSGEWPHYADGLGRSLEKIVPEAPGVDPASWANSVANLSGEFERRCVVGPLANLFTQRFIVTIDGAGEYVIDDIVLEPVDMPGVNLIANGDFEAGDTEWSLRGNVEGSRVVEGIGVDGSAGLLLVSEGRCFDLCNTLNGVSTSFRSGTLDVNADYRLCLTFRYVNGSTNLIAGLLNGVGLRTDGTNVSPGAPNSRAANVVPPFISHRGRNPQEPTSADAVWLSTRVRTPAADPVELVMLTYSVDGAETTLAMRDDGMSGDAFAGDGVYGVEVPSFPHNTQVLYRIEARSTGGAVSYSPRASNLTFSAEETWGYYVNDHQDATPLPTFHVLIPGVDPQDPIDINRVLNCSTVLPSAFAYEGELYPNIGTRFRGNTACWIKKRNLKLRFNRGRFFQGVAKINLQGLWTDKALVREALSWDFMREIGLPYSETEYVRVHLNGQYHGLFLCLEHPDSRFLDRNGLDDDGFLYKARQPPRAGGATPIGVSAQPDRALYPQFWEEETREDGDFNDVADFIEAMHDDGNSVEGPTAEFMQLNVDAEHLIGYQIVQATLNNIDSFAKNHFLYMDTRTGLWSLLTWDVDLTFGKFFDPNVVGAGREVGTLNDCMLSPNFDLDPWFTTDVRSPAFPVLNHFVEFFFTADEGFFQRAYLVRLWDILQEKYTIDSYNPRIDMLVELIDADQAEDFDRWGRYPPDPDFPECIQNPDLATQIGIVRQQIKLHRQFLIDFIRLFHTEIPDHDRMKITEIMFDPEGPDEDLEFVELLNTSGRRIDISGWQLAGGIEFTVPLNTLVEADGLVVVAKSRADFLRRYQNLPEGVIVVGDFDGRLSNEGEVVRLLDDGPGHPATVDFVDFADGFPWPDVRDGYSIELSSPAPNRDNDVAANWVESASRGGSPGALGTPFVRGDGNHDFNVDVSDGVYILDYLFRGGPPPVCDDAADVNDDGGVAISDAIYVLNHLFLGRAAPPEPYPALGLDPTADKLGCDG